MLICSQYVVLTCNTYQHQPPLHCINSYCGNSCSCLRIRFNHLQKLNLLLFPFDRHYFTCCMSHTCLQFVLLCLAQYPRWWTPCSRMGRRSFSLTQHTSANNFHFTGMVVLYQVQSSRQSIAINCCIETNAS